MKTVTKASVVVLAVVFGLFSSLAYGEKPPVPDAQVVPPGPDVPDGVRAFFGNSGKWGDGAWTSSQAPGYMAVGMEVVMIFEKITSNKAWVIYAWGSCPNWYVDHSGWERYEGEFITDKKGRTILSLLTKGGKTLEFTIKDGKLIGFNPGKRWSSEVILRPL